MSTLPEQIAELAAQVAKPITLDDLPLGQLRKKLIDDGEPLDLSIVGLAGQTADFGGGKPTLRWGTATIVWPGGTPTCTTLTVTHGLEKTPTQIILSPQHDGATKYLAVNTLNRTATSFDITATTVDATNPAAAATQSIDWQAKA